MISLSQETEFLAKRLVDMQSVSVEDAIRQAIEYCARSVGLLPENRWPRDMSPEAILRRRQQAREIIDEIAAMRINDPRPISDIIDALQPV